LTGTTPVGTPFLAGAAAGCRARRRGASSAAGARSRDRFYALYGRPAPRRLAGRAAAAGRRASALPDGRAAGSGMAGGGAEGAALEDVKEMVTGESLGFVPSAAPANRPRFARSQ